MTDQVKIAGVYKYESGGADNFDTYLKAMGVAVVKRQIAEKSPPQVTIMKKFDGWHVFTESDFLTSDVVFNFDQQFEEVTPDTRLCLSIVHRDGNKWIHTQKWGNHDADHTTVMTREFVDGGMYVTYACNNIECVRYYIRVTDVPDQPNEDIE